MPRRKQSKKKYRKLFTCYPHAVCHCHTPVALRAGLALCYGGKRCQASLGLLVGKWIQSPGVADASRQVIHLHNQGWVLWQPADGVEAKEVREASASQYLTVPRALATVAKVVQRLPRGNSLRFT